MNKDNLYQWKRSDKSMIYPPYTNFTKKLKSIKGQPTDRVTWGNGICIWYSNSKPKVLWS